MYLVGAAHPHRAEAQLTLERLVTAKERLVCDAEVLQEILHRYAAIDRRQAIQPALNLLLAIVDHVIPIEREDVLRAAEIVAEDKRLSARDSIHIAIMERHGIKAIFSFDTDFDRRKGLRRIAKL